MIAVQWQRPKDRKRFARHESRIKNHGSTTRESRITTHDSPIAKDRERFTRHESRGTNRESPVTSHPSKTHALLRPPPTECLRDSFAFAESSAPCCINFLPPRWSRFPRKTFFCNFLVFFFLAMSVQYVNHRRASNVGNVTSGR